jgi:hypothetical protein
MGVEYVAVIAEDDYHAFKILVSTPLPREYDMWLRVRERGKLRAIEERDAVVVEVQVRPEEFGAYCKGLKRPDFSIRALDRCARAKGIAEGWMPARCNQNCWRAVEVGRWRSGRTYSSPARTGASPTSLAAQDQTFRNLLSFRCVSSM